MVIVPQHRAGHARFRPEISNERLQRQDGGRDSIGAVPDWGCAGHLRLETDDSVRPRPLNRSLQSLATVNDLDRIDASAPDSETYSPRLSLSLTTRHCGLDRLLECSSALETLRAVAEFPLSPRMDRCKLGLAVAFKAHRGVTLPLDSQ